MSDVRKRVSSGLVLSFLGAILTVLHVLPKAAISIDTPAHTPHNKLKKKRWPNQMKAMDTPISFRLRRLHCLDVSTENLKLTHTGV